MTRRTFLVGIGAAAAARAQSLVGAVYAPAEWSLTSARTYVNPFTDVDVDAVIRGSGGKEVRVPAFWAGGNIWRVRFAPEEAGEYAWQIVSSDGSNSGLHNRRGVLRTVAGDSTNLLSTH